MELSTAASQAGIKNRPVPGPSKVTGYDGGASAIQPRADFGQDAMQRASLAPVPEYRRVTGLSRLADTWRLLGQAIRSGEKTYLPGQLPSYPTLDPSLKARALEAGRGRTIAQPLLASDRAGTHVHDPVNLVIRGSRESVARALESQGWVQASKTTWLSGLQMAFAVLFHTHDDPNAPMSDQYLDGKVADLSFNKNSDYAIGRDHLRVYHRGQDPVTGEDLWAIAAIRDYAVTLRLKRPDTHGSPWPWKWDWHAPSFFHSPDENIDGERDLVMEDLVKSGMVKDWAAVDGQLPPGQRKQRTGTNQYMLIDRYPTDGKVYEVTLGQ